MAGEGERLLSASSGRSLISNTPLFSKRYALILCSYIQITFLFAVTNIYQN